MYEIVPNGFERSIGRDKGIHVKEKEKVSQPYSFRDSLLEKEGAASVNLVEDICLEDKDVVIESDDSIPQISFSDRVHNFITNNMKTPVFVNVIGRNMGVSVASCTVDEIMVASRRFHYG